ncbi:MAG: hypothetical protein B6244_03950 [Candidatus Cloacimonetes bacterium 4572_55]|nr:MAG: hypothetical protein B6244_03950 [Candidatus Cloacimonetes bacterium 4572_55]
MRTFSSYGPISVKTNYFAPREELVDQIYRDLIGVEEGGGHYITIWAPRQTGKTWALMQVADRIFEEKEFDLLMINVEILKDSENSQSVLQGFVHILSDYLDISSFEITKWIELADIFTDKFFKKPVILIIDEFDALDEKVINKFASVFRSIYNKIRSRSGGGASYMLHGLALIGIRSVLGIENVKGSPFNVQRSVHIPNLTYDEVNAMFHSYIQESGQKIDQDVVDRLFTETYGQPGLVSWFGELLTEKFNRNKNKSITMEEWGETYKRALFTEPNNTILNLISKASHPKYKGNVLELYRTDEKTDFSFRKVEHNYLYMNGIISYDDQKKIRFSSPFVQKCLFERFSDEIFDYVGVTMDPFTDLSGTVTESALNIPKIIDLYCLYLKKNSGWLFQDAPRRKDMQIFEAAYHFNLYRYLFDFLKTWNSQIFPEFPTGNGKIDLLIRHGGRLYALELKSYRNTAAYRKALVAAARYGDQLNLDTIYLLFFVERIDEANRQKFEVDYKDQKAEVTVQVIFVVTRP